MLNYRKIPSKIKNRSNYLKWSTVAVGSSLIRPLSRNKTMWHVREGIAEAKNRRFAKAALAYEKALEDDDAPVEWQFRLGWCRRKAGDIDGSLGPLQTAYKADQQPSWVVNLALAYFARGEFETSVAILGELDDDAAINDLPTGLELASIYSAIGNWERAAEVIRRLALARPRNADLRRRLWSRLNKILTWGGTFTTIEPNRAKATFQFKSSEELAAIEAEARQAMEEAIALDSSHHTWFASLGEARFNDGDVDGAVDAYDKLIEASHFSNGRWAIKSKHKWQFLAEKLRFDQGHAREEDPVFACQIEPLSAQPSFEAKPIVGAYDPQVTYLGFTFEGFLASTDADTVELWMNGEKVREVNVSRDSYFPAFRFHLKRSTVEVLPPDASLVLCTPDGERLLTKTGATETKAQAPHGSNELFDLLANGTKVTKKGEVSKSVEETRQRQLEYLRIYDLVRDFFEQKLDRSLFLMYGTLLGYYRDGDFIPTDDDFDGGYISTKTTPEEVKAEAQDLIVELVKAGFTVSINRRGKLFRVQLERGRTDGYHLDLRPLWFQDGKLWVHNHCSYPTTVEKFLPVENGTLRGTRVSIPKDTEDFLRNHYGPGWKVPDPGFVYYADEVDPNIRTNLDAARITTAEYRKFEARIDREIAGVDGAGRLVSIGGQSLYPLEDCVT